MPSPVDFTDLELSAYIAETLTVSRAVQLEAAIRQSPAMQQRLARLIADEDHGRPGIGDLWRRGRLACPRRGTWSAYLAGQIHGEFTEYLRFHLEEVGCRFCAANVADLQEQADPAAAGRVRKFFETSVGRLRELPDAAELPADELRSE